MPHDSKDLDSAELVLKGEVTNKSFESLNATPGDGRIEIEGFVRADIQGATSPEMETSISVDLLQ